MWQGRRDSDPTSGPLSPSSGSGFAGFFLPLLQPMLRMGAQPAIRQQSFQGSRIAGGNGRKPFTKHSVQLILDVAFQVGKKHLPVLSLQRVA